MKVSHPLRLIVIALVLLLVGALLPFLMVIRIVQPSFALSFLSYAASLVGLVLGLIGVAGRTR
ncbi:MAG: hypothetical protein N3E42_05845 [Candidatus Bipolaricaulota bacterium]|nr:hypothetical protein [Candidatus Bipolaricaulota bacterium]